MKLIISLIFVPFLAACGMQQTTSATTDADRESNVKVADYPKVERLFSEMSESASNGASLMHFDYAQAFWFEGDLARDCLLYSAEETVDFIKDYARSMFTGGRGLASSELEMIDGAHDEIKQMVGLNEYYLCSKSYGASHAYASESYLIGKDGQLRLMLEYAVED